MATHKPLTQNPAHWDNVLKRELAYRRLTAGAQTSALIRYGTSDAFLNKEAICTPKYCHKHKRYDTCWAFGRSFVPVETTPAKFIEHVLNGGAWTPAAYASNTRRKDTFVSSELIALDFDENVGVGDLLELPFIRQSAMLVYSTPSDTPEYRRSRLVIRLECPISSYAEYEALVKSLIAALERFAPDRRCYDAARFFYGSTKPGAHVNTEATCSIDALKTFIAEMVATPDRSTVKVDAETGRLAIATSNAPLLLLHAINIRNGSKIAYKAFWRAAAEHGITYGSKQRKRLLEQGRGIFWDIDYLKRVIYLRRPEAALVEQARAINPALVASNLPGMKRAVHVPITSNLEEWQALLYAGWIASKRITKITRDRQALLFGRTKQTIRRWEREYLTGILKTTHTLAQQKLDNSEDINPPEHHYTYTVRAMTPSTPQIEKRIAWRLPNTYTSKLRLHASNGQRRRILARSKMALQPAHSCEGGLLRNRQLFFTQPEAAHRTASKQTTAVYLLIGRAKNGYIKYEPVTTGAPLTSADERILSMSWGGYHAQ